MQTSALWPNGLTAFRPDGDRGRILYRQVKGQLVQSLGQIAVASRSAVDVNEASLNSCLDALTRADHVSARVFGIYNDLLVSINGQNIPAVSKLFSELVEQDFGRQGTGCYNLTDHDLGLANAARYIRWTDVDPENPLHLTAINEREFDRITNMVSEAFALLDGGAPEISSEIRALVSEIVFAKTSEGERSAFHGVSSFCLWGVLLCNAQSHETTLEVIQTLAHESCHLHLFGAALDGPLVLNSEDERYPSPLRPDPRPMDGLYHATYVAARMYYAIARLLESGRLDKKLHVQAETDLRGNMRAFHDGLATIEAHGRLTELGNALLADARDYMAGAYTGNQPALP